MNKLQVEVQQAAEKAVLSNMASLQAQVPSVAQLPCSSDHLFEGTVANEAPHLVGAPEMSWLLEGIKHLLAISIGGLGKRSEAERRQEAE